MTSICEPNSIKDQSEISSELWPQKKKYFLQNENKPNLTDSEEKWCWRRRRETGKKTKNKKWKRKRGKDLLCLMHENHNSHGETGKTGETFELTGVSNTTKMYSTAHTLRKKRGIKKWRLPKNIFLFWQTFRGYNVNQ